MCALFVYVSCFVSTTLMAMYTELSDRMDEPEQANMGHNGPGGRTARCSIVLIIDV